MPLNPEGLLPEPGTSPGSETLQHVTTVGKVVDVLTGKGGGIILISRFILVIQNSQGKKNRELPLLVGNEMNVSKRFYVEVSAWKSSDRDLAYRCPSNRQPQQVPPFPTNPFPWAP